jgi:urease accessory protein
MLQAHKRTLGVEAKLQVTVRYRDRRTLLQDVYCQSPLKITKGFPQEDGIAVTVMDISPGMMDGDRYSLDWDVGVGCRLAITTQSYGKVHPCPYIGATHTTRMNIASDAFVLYEPLPLMLYADAALRASLHVSLEEGAVFIAQDSWCAGRVARGEIHDYQLYENDVRIDIMNRPVYVNRLRICPKNPFLRAPGALEEVTHFGTLYAFGTALDRSKLEDLQQLAQGFHHVRCAVSQAAHHGITAVVLGKTAWEIQDALSVVRHALVPDFPHHV